MIKLCKRGHERTPENVDKWGACKICVQIRGKLKHLADPEKYRLYSMNWRKDNPEKSKASVAKWRAENLDSRKAYSAEWHRNNRIKGAASAARSRAKNPEKCKARVVKWLANNKDKAKDYGHQRRAKVRGVTVSAIKATDIFERDNWICGICYEKVDKKLKHPHPKSKSLDHIIPVSLGGEHSPRNVQLAHLGCNCRKHNRGTGDQMRLF